LKQIAVGPAPTGPVFAFPDNGLTTAPAFSDVFVNAVHACVQLPSDKPSGVGRVPVKNAIPGSQPDEFVRPCRPGLLEIGSGALVELEVGSVSSGCKPRRSCKFPVFLEKIGKIVGIVVRHTHKAAWQSGRRILTSGSRPPTQQPAALDCGG